MTTHGTTSVSMPTRYQRHVVVSLLASSCHHHHNLLAIVNLPSMISSNSTLFLKCVKDKNFKILCLKAPKMTWGTSPYKCSQSLSLSGQTGKSLANSNSCTSIKSCKTFTKYVECREALRQWRCIGIMFYISCIAVCQAWPVVRE